jgi:hypothetical protein
MFRDWEQLDRSAAIVQNSLNEYASRLTWCVWDAKIMQEQGYTEPEELVVNATYGDEFTASMTVSVFACQVFSRAGLAKNIVRHFAVALGKHLVGVED